MQGRSIGEMLRRCWTPVLAGVTLVVTLAASAQAQDPQSRPRPAAKPAPTKVLNLTPPAGWVVSMWRGGDLEMAEFTPKGQEGDAYKDLIAYTVFAADKPVSQAGLRELLKETGSCDRLIQRETQRTSGWYDDQVFCAGRKNTPNPDLVELTFRTSQVQGQQVFQVWRAWRGTSAELAGLLATRTNVRLPASGKIDDATITRLLEALTTSYWPDIAKAEVCDLTKVDACAAFHGAVPAAFNPLPARIADKGSVLAGLYAPGLDQISFDRFRQLLGQPPAVPNGAPRVVIISVNKEEWADPATIEPLINFVAIGEAADGGALVVLQPKDSAQTAAADLVKVRATMVQQSRRLWKPGLSPDTVQVILPAKP